MSTASTTPDVLLIPKREAARMLGVSERTLHDLTREGVVPHLRLGERGVRYSVKSLETFIETQLATT